MQDLSTLISTRDLAKALKSTALRILDCRFTLDDPQWGRSAYREGHIPGAQYAHLDEDLSGPLTAGAGRHPLPDPLRFKETLEAGGIHNSDRVVAYDQGNGGIAARAWWLLRWVGHKQVAVLDGGWKAWVAGGYPVSMDIPAPERSDYALAMREGLYIDASEVAAWQGQADHMIVDSRTHERYTGEEEPIDPVAGHIPGAINLPFPENVDAGGMWKKPSALRRRFAGLPNPERTAFYCGSGVTACHNVLAYKHAGLGDALLYAGSWSEWIADPGRSVASGENKHPTNPRG